MCEGEGVWRVWQVMNLFPAANGNFMEANDCRMRMN